jgi:NADPH:quinone reductase
LGALRAVVISRFGGPGVLELMEVPDPIPGLREVRIAVHAAAVNPVDAANRTDGSWAGLRLPAIIGSDFSGVIDSVGADVSEWRRGDEVFGAAPFRGGGQGTYAEFHVANAETIARKPANLSHAEAAAVPLAGGTAHTVINRRLCVEPGARVLIHGAGGGVGVFAVQLVAAAGAQAVALASRRHHELLLDLGASAAIDYHDPDALATAQQLAGGEFDAVADFVGGTCLPSSLVWIREGGRAATIVELKGDLDLALDRNITVHGVLLDRSDRSLFDELCAAIEAGKLRPVVSTVLPLEEVVEAHRLLEAGHVQGKLVVAIRT